MPDPNYDPNKAHEYYLRTRELKGRHAGSGPDKGPGRQSHNQDQASAQAKVREIEAKLNKLRDLLHKKLASASSKDKKASVTDKLKQKQQSKDYYEKHKQKIAQDKKKSGGGSSSSGTYESMSATELKTAIRNTVVQLKAAIANARS